MSELSVDRRPDRLEVTLDHPSTRNAISRAMVDELHAVCAELEAEPRILVLAGSPEVFASGADIAELRERTAADALAGINSRIFDRIARLPMPVIAAIDGWALGGGAELAYAADIRIAGEGLRIGNPETGLGIIAAAGATWRLPEIVGDALARELLFTGRTLDAGEALAAGLVSRVVPSTELLKAAHEIADRIARNDPLATRLTKAVLAAPRSAHPAIDEQTQALLFESPEKRRRMTEFLTRKKKPT
ncbi:enoyl-CoA hydratase/isomerase family protein [Promicromonospora sp. Populi]|uniref:enoyl-CoA hydratase/isomerase family protein n=1 Tax=Promicromonospora sp. Populi TaxID=3239420 RepID=UPI0034E2A2DC